MTRVLGASFAIVALTAPLAAQAPADLIRTYCTSCHSPRVLAGGVALEAPSAETVPAQAEVWEAAVRKLRGRLMPPPGSRQPDQREIDAFVSWMESTLDASAAGPVAGHVPLQRLTRTEFATTVNALLGVELDAEEILPAEIEVDGFENIAAALSVSPAFLDQYVAAARLAARLAVGESVPKVGSAYYPLPEGDLGSQARHVDGLPLGTRGGMAFRHHFPADGEYRFTIPDLGIDLYTFALETRHTVILLMDDREVFRASLGGPDDLRTVDRQGAPGRAALMERFTDVPVQVRAGTRDVVVTFVERARAESDQFVQDLRNDAFSQGDPMPVLRDGVRVAGPFDSPGISQTASRRRLFVCRPGPDAAHAEERACARRIAESLARRAFRRPVTHEDLDSLMPYFEGSGEPTDLVPPTPQGEGRPNESRFDRGIERLVAAVLVSPEFLYRTVPTPDEAPPRDAFLLDDLALASRLSFFLWSQGPDDTLLELATAGELSDPDVLEAQALRMLDDPRASSLVGNFALRWLNLDNLAEVEPDPDRFPTFSEPLRRDLASEIESFVASVLLEDRNVGDLLTANHTFLNERLARHYGITSVLGPQFRRVELDDPRRWGVLGKGAMHMRTSYGDRTSPVLRGAWVLDKLMGTPPTPPPPDTATDLSDPAGAPPRTVRDRLERHRQSPSCSQCHGVIDPIGLALENFDAIGRWRDVDVEADAAIDARTVLPNGRTVDGPVALRDALFGGTDQFVRGFTEKLTMYALGRELEYYDMPQVRAVVRRAANEDYRLSAIVAAIVTSDAFRRQGHAED